MYQNLRNKQLFFVYLGSRSQLHCTTETEGVDLCKDYAVDNVECKNLKYETDEPPKWNCDFKFKAPNVTAFRYEVIYGLHIYDGEIKKYCYINETSCLDYSLESL